MPERILVVDDEIDLCEILKFNLENLGYIVDVAGSAEEALTLELSRYHLFLLDVMMEGMSGFSLGARLKKDPLTAHIPIIFVTAKGAENDTLTGFSIGADDYIHKPFRLSEVAARVKAVLRRTQHFAAHGQLEECAETIVYEDLHLDLKDRRATISGEDLTLTRKEYEMLLLLLRHPGHIFSREEILEKVWPEDVLVLERSVDVNIARLRKKLKGYADCIVSRSGYGYMFRDIKSSE